MDKERGSFLKADFTINRIVKYVNTNIKAYKEDRKLCETEEDMKVYDTVIGNLSGIQKILEDYYSFR